MEASAEKSDNVKASAEKSDNVEASAEQSDNVEASAEMSDNVEASAEKSDSVEASAEMSDSVEASAEMSDSVEASAEMSDSMETETGEDPEEGPETEETEGNVSGPVTRHRANRRPSSPKAKKRGSRRRLGFEDESKDADSTSHKEEAGEEEADTKTDADASELLQGSDADITEVPTEGVLAGDDSENSRDPKDDTAPESSVLPDDATSGRSSEDQEQSECGQRSVKLQEQSEESASLSSESDSTDSDLVANAAAQSKLVSAEGGDEEDMPTLTNEATFSEVSYDVEEMDEISSLAADLLSGWSELKVSVTETDEVN